MRIYDQYPTPWHGLSKPDPVAESQHVYLMAGNETVWRLRVTETPDGGLALLVNTEAARPDEVTGIFPTTSNVFRFFQRIPGTDLSEELRDALVAVEEAADADSNDNHIAALDLALNLAVHEIQRRP